jgi:hypothetical protein
MVAVYVKMDIFTIITWRVVKVILLNLISNYLKINILFKKYANTLAKIAFLQLNVLLAFYKSMCMMKMFKNVYVQKCLCPKMS